MFCFVFFVTPPLQSFPFFNTPTKQDPAIMIEQLQKQQIENPNDQWTNYNLGVAFYKTNKYAEAHTSFERALFTCTDQNLKKNCLFNLGNSLYKETLAILPFNWEINDIDQPILEQAIELIKNAIKQYENLITLDKNDIKTTPNKNKSVDLLKKLEKKRKKQEGKKNSPQNGQQEEKTKDTGEKQENHAAPTQSPDQQKNKSPEQSKENQQQKQGEQGTNQSNQKSNQGRYDKFDNQKQKDDSKQQTQSDRHTQPHDDQNQQKTNPQSYGMKTDEQKQEFEKEQKNVAETGTATSQEMQNLTALLNNLQADEAKAQKALISETLKNKKHIPYNSQKPW